MSKPDDIPQDVWDAAVQGAEEMRHALYAVAPLAAKLWATQGVIEEMHVQFARAIMAATLAERERCIAKASVYGGIGIALAQILKRGEP